MLFCLLPRSVSWMTPLSPWLAVEMMVCARCDVKSFCWFQLWKVWRRLNRIFYVWKAYLLKCYCVFTIFTRTFPFPLSPFITSSVYIVYSWQLLSLSPLQVWDRRALREDNPKPVGVLAGGDGLRFRPLVIFCPQILKQRDIPQTQNLNSLKISRPRWRNCLLGPTRGRAPPD